jgi:hypothetical protein
MKNPTKQQLLEEIETLKQSLREANAHIHWLKLVVEKSRDTAYCNGTIQGEIIGAICELREQLAFYDRLYVNIPPVKVF